MQQTSPAPFVFAEAARRDATSSSFRQTALIGHFGAFSHLEDDLDAVVHEACRVAAEGIGAKFAGVLQYWADKDAFVLQAGVGWPARMVGRTRIAADLSTTAGLAWLIGQPVHSRQLGATGQVRAPEAFVEHGAHRMVSLPIRGDGRNAFGVLEVGSSETSEFTPCDLSFLRRLADRVAAAVRLQAGRTGLAAEQRATLASRSNAAAEEPRSLVGIGHRHVTQGGDG